jgi:hypothetical protein
VKTPGFRLLVDVVSRVAGLGALLAGVACGGGVPLMHGAHPLAPGHVRLGAGLSASLTASEAAKIVSGAVVDGDAAVLQEAAAPSALAPWIGGRMGFEGGYDAGLTYTGRVIRLDGRRSFSLGDGGMALSLGLAASGVLPKRHDDLGLRTGGFGADLPIVLGYRGSGGRYAVWLGLRGGAEILNGQRERVQDAGLDPLAPLPSDALEAWHAQGGALLGFRIGVGRIDAVFELGGAMHFARGSLDEVELEIRRFDVRPATALVGRFD